MKNYLIRNAGVKDAEGILNIYRPFVKNTAVSFELIPPDIRETESRIRKCGPRYPWLVCVKEDLIVGYAYAGMHRKREAYQWTAEVSVYVHEDFRKKGIATALYTSLLGILKLQGFRNILAGITAPNPASIGFHKNFGFSFFARYENVGFKFGNWHSTEWYRLAFSPENTPPVDLIPVSDLENTGQWRREIERGLRCIRA